MASYSLNANDQSVQTPRLTKGRVRLSTSVNIYWAFGDNPIAGPGCAMLPAGQNIELKLPVNCIRLAVMAVSIAGSATIIEIQGGARASCSA